MDITAHKKLTRKFYKRDVLIVARDLLGKYLVKNSGEKLFAGMIVEVEAYHGSTDEAAHTFRGKTLRNAIMFNEGGYFYVYFTYGAHFCCNIVTGWRDEGTAVLIRAVEPVEGINDMMFNRFGKVVKQSGKDFFNLTSGPGKLCQAFNIGRKEYGVDLTGDYVYLLDNKRIPDENVVTTHRVGIKKSADLPWRFYIKNNPFVSKK